VTTNDAGDGKVLAITGQSNGTATLNADSTFQFRPNPGFEGSASFTYTVTNGFGTSAPATVSMTVANPVWFLNSSAAGGGDGRYDTPFNALSSFAAINNGAGNNPAANDRIFLYTGAYTGPVTLLNGQQLIGQGATGSSFSSLLGVTWPADSGTEPAINGNSPSITSGTTGVTLGSGNTLRGFNLGNTTGAALIGTSFGTVVVTNVGINTTGQALNLTTGTLNGSFTQLRSTGGTNNVSLTGVATTGTSTLGGAGDVLSGATSDAFVVAGGTGSYIYSGNVTQTSNAATVNVNGGHSGTLTFQTGTVSATNGTGLQFNNADGTYAFSGTTTLNGGNAGIDVSNGSAGSFTFPSTSSITNPTAEMVAISNSAPTFSYAGTLSKTNGSGSGITLSSNTGGTITFSGTSKVFSTGASAAVNITGNGAAIAFTGGGLDIDVSGSNATGFTASGGGSVTVQGSNNTIDLTTGSNAAVALSVSGTTIASGGLNFTRISSNGGVNGIVLNNTGSTAGLTVSGNGGTCAGAATCTGGTIQNTTGDAISLTNTINPTFSRMAVQNNGGSGLRASVVSGLSLSSSIVDNNADVNGGTEAGILLLNMSGTNVISASTVRNSFEDNIRWTPSSGAQTLNLTNVTVGPTDPTNGNTGVNIIGTNTANATLNVTGGTFTQNKSFGIGTSFSNQSAHTVNVSGATFTDNNMAIGLATVDDADVTFDIANNLSILRSATNAIQVLAGASSTSNSQIRGKIRNNVIGDNTVNSGARDGIGIAIEVNDDADAIVDVTGNNIKHTDQDGIFIQARDPNTGDGNTATAVADFTVTGNTVGTPDDNTAFPFFTVYGVRVESRHNTTVCLDLANNTSSDVGAVGHFYLRQRNTTSVFKLERYSGSGTDDTAVANFVKAQNPYAGVTATATPESATGFTGVANGTCRTAP
jgi:hypothetical protein